MKLCPRCDAATKVNGTKRIGATIVRYRRCLNPDCGHDFKTTQTQEEYAMEDFVPLADSQGRK